MQRDKKFFYEQYEQLNWKNQEETKINSQVNDYISDEVIMRHENESISLFDIGFGVGFFITNLSEKLKTKYKYICIEGCEPAKVSYEHFSKKDISGVELKISNQSFLDISSDKTFDFITAIYVFPHFTFDDLESVIKKINSMLNIRGKFIMVITSEKSYKEGLVKGKDLFNLVEDNKVIYQGKEYQEYLHKSLIPGIGDVYDFNRDEALYLEMFKNNGFSVNGQKELNDGYFLNKILVFEKK